MSVFRKQKNVDSVVTFDYGNQKIILPSTTGFVYDDRYLKGSNFIIFSKMCVFSQKTFCKEVNNKIKKVVKK